MRFQDPLATPLSSAFEAHMDELLILNQRVECSNHSGRTFKLFHRRPKVGPATVNRIIGVRIAAMEHLYLLI